MNLQELWVELEHEAASSGRRGILRRRLAPEIVCDLFVGVEIATVVRRMLIVRVLQSAAAAQGKLPEAKGCELLVKHLPEDPADHVSVCLSLLDPRFKDVFSSLVLDIIGHLRELHGDAAIFAGLVGRIERWQRFLDRNDPDGLGVEAQRGLLGKVWFLKNHLIPMVGIPDAVASWKGPYRTPHDFQLPAASVEVKTTIAKQHIKLEITSERQLDDTNVPLLALFHLLVDAGATGVSLPDLIAEVRNLLGTVASRDLFEDLLVEAGYLDVHADRYREPCYHIRATHMFHVRPGFPRLVERDLPPGVGDLRYTVLLASCLDFAMPEATWSQILRGHGHE